MGGGLRKGRSMKFTILKVRYIVFACLSLFAFAHCGKQGPPVVPLLVTPQSVTDLKAEMDCGRIKLTFTLPQTNNDGSDFDDFYGFQVYRQILKAPIPLGLEEQIEKTLKTILEQGDSLNLRDAEDNKLDDAEEKPMGKGNLSPSSILDKKNKGRILSFQEKIDYPYVNLPYKTVVKKFKKIGEFTRKEFIDAEEGGFADEKLYPKGKNPFTFFDSGYKLDDGFESEAGYIYRYNYKIKLINENDDYSPLSNVATLLFKLPPSPPTELGFQRKGNSISLFWEPPINLCNGLPYEGKLLFNVYRRSENAAFIPLPLNPVPLTTFSYTIDFLELDQTYFFTVRTVLISPYRESELALPLEVKLQDVEPPQVPRDLVALQSMRLVSLLWIEVKDKDLAGYNIYRKTGEKEEWKLLNEKPHPSNTYVDRTVSMDKTYFYAVTAVDRSPQANESEKSNIEKIAFR